MWADRCLPLCYTKLLSPQEGLARHGGCRTRSLDLYFGSRMESDWPHKKSDLRVSHKNETRDKKSWVKKDAAKGYSKPKGIHENQIIRERSFNGAGNLIIAALN
jgi:hypothetical protein